MYNAEAASPAGENMKKTLTLVLINMLALFSIGTAGSVDKTGDKMTNTHEYLKIPFETINGDTTSLSDYEGKAILLVNVASKCGNTPQYAGLEKLFEKYKDQGLEVIGFPANNFGGQEPGTNKEILQFCTSNYHVTFPMMAKVSVKGNDIHPLFAYLTEDSNIPGDITWNFSKFLIDKHGNLVARFSPKVEPSSKDIVSEVEKILK